jgi:hypothetical protein
VSQSLFVVNGLLCKRDFWTGGLPGELWFILVGIRLHLHPVRHEKEFHSAVISEVKNLV